ncbi:ABC transporter [Clostridiales bacterium PH28_bin88]|nr:ABC transporter [Clostridiales bacterium PH28_bin88]
MKNFRLKNAGNTVVILVIALAFYGLVKVGSSTGMLNDYWQRVLDQALITTIGALGLSIIYGFTGQFSLGHAAFYGLGAYTAGVISKVWGHGDAGYLVLAMVAGTLMAAVVSLLVGLPILRLRSDYLGIATLGFGIIVKVAMDNSNKVFAPLGGATGMTGVPQVINFDLIFVFAVLAILLVRNFITSSYGRACVTIREDEIAADVMGIDTTRYKVMAFALGCALAGFAGTLYAHRYPYLHPTSFDWLKAFDFLLIVVLGGLGSMSGTIATAVSWVFLLEGLRIVLGEAFVDYRGVIYALILIITILLRPQGLFSGKELKILVPSQASRKAASREEGSHARLGG